jgi:hypothetical protein
METQRSKNQAGARFRYCVIWGSVTEEVEITEIGARVHSAFRRAAGLSDFLGPAGAASIFQV